MPREPRVLCSARGARRGRGALRRCPPRLDVQRFFPRTHGCDVSSLATALRPDPLSLETSSGPFCTRNFLKRKRPDPGDAAGPRRTRCCFASQPSREGPFSAWTYGPHFDIASPHLLLPDPSSPKRFLECLHCSRDAGTQSPSPKELRATPVRQVLLVSRGHPKRSRDTVSRRGACVRNRCLRKTGSLLQTRG